MRAVHVLVLMVVGLDVVCGMVLQNSSLIANNLSDDDDIMVFSRPKRGVGTVIAIGSLIGALVGGVSLGVRAIPSEYTRNFEMHVENNLEWTLQDAKSIVWYGHIARAPTVVQSCSKGLVTGHKQAYTATGTSGLASWRIREQNLTIILFWDVPFSGSCNSLGLGLYTDLHVSEPRATKRTNYISDLFFNHLLIPDSGDNVDKTSVNLASCDSANEFCTTNKGIRVCGVMSTNSAAHIRVRVEHIDDDVTNCHGNQ